MTQEEKELLFVDLCARLPYGVKVQYLTEGDKTYICNIDQVSIKSQCVGIAEIGHTVFTWRTIDRIKPYLRPMSSMTEEEKEEMHNLLSPEGTAIYENNGISVPMNHYGDFVPYEFMNKIIQYLLKNHFDFMDLIPKGLAIEVTEENNPYKD